MSSLRPGDTLRNKFLIEAELGAGGMGTVYQAIHIRMQTRVAIKVLDRNHAEHSANVGRFEREALAAARLRGAHAVRVYDVDTTDAGVPFLVMELLRGTELSTALQAPDQPRELLIDWAIQICSAIHEAHQLGIIHRDLKPSNVFVVEPSNQIKIVDFGISKVRDSVDLTADSEILGTPKYMSPEQLQGEPVGPHSDVWAIGIILYRMLAGKHAFLVPPNSAPFVLAASTLTQEPVPITEYCPALPQELANAVMKCLEKEIVSRWQSARDLALCLEPFGSGNVQFEEVPAQEHASSFFPFPPQEVLQQSGRAPAPSLPPTAVELKKIPNEEHAGIFHLDSPLDESAPATTGVAPSLSQPGPRPDRRVGWTLAAILLVAIGATIYMLGFRNGDSGVVTESPSLARSGNAATPASTEPPAARSAAGDDARVSKSDDGKAVDAADAAQSSSARPASTAKPTRPPSTTKPPSTRPAGAATENPLYL